MNRDRFFEALKPFLAPAVDHGVVRRLIVRELQHEADVTIFPHSVGLEQLAHKVRLGNVGLDAVARALDSIEAEPVSRTLASIAETLSEAPAHA